MKKMMMIILLAGYALLCSCTTSIAYRPTIKKISWPNIGETVMINVGDKMLVQGKHRLHEAIVLEQTTKVGAFLSSYRLSPGNYYKDHTKGNIDYYLPYRNYPNSGHAQKSHGLAAEFHYLMIKDNKKLGVKVNDPLVSDFWNSKAKFKKEDIPLTSKDYFQQTLLYSGLVGDKINISYREASGSRIRPAFNNNVEYDLSKSKVIGYKGCQLEIIKATNQYIQFKVIRNFN